MFPRLLWLPLVLAVVTPSARAEPPPGYYASAQGLTGAVLRAALHNIIDHHTVVPYSGSTQDTVRALRLLDEDPLDPNRVILIYSRRSESKTNFNAPGPFGWNREHLWPNSFGIDDHHPAYSDLFNLRPEDATVNSARGNKYFDLSDTNDTNFRRPAHLEAPFASTDTDSWEPPHSVKGDIARALFYMDLRYEGDATNELDFILTENTDAIASNTNLMGRLLTLLRWHRLDPVDAEELRRNDLIFERYQHNRNPFVDHPEWVASIWPPLRPRLFGEVATNFFQLSWSTNDPDAVVEWSPVFPPNWLALEGLVPQRLGSNFVVRLPISPNGAALYRLREP